MPVIANCPADMTYEGRLVRSTPRRLSIQGSAPVIVSMVFSAVSRASPQSWFGSRLYSRAEPDKKRVDSMKTGQLLSGPEYIP